MKKKLKLSRRTKILGAITVASAGVTIANVIHDQKLLIDINNQCEMNHINTITTLAEKLQSFMGKEAFMDFVASTCCNDKYTISIDVPILGE